MASDLTVYVICSDRHAVIIQNRNELSGIDPELDHHQAAELGIAVLLDDEDAFVVIDKVTKGSAKWKCARAHCVEMDAFFIK